MAKILNLDALAAKEVREVVLGGTTHQIKEMSVEDFIEINKSAQKLEGVTDMAVQISETINILQRAIPTVDKNALMDLSFEQLTALSAFVRGDDPEQIAGAESEGK